MARVFFSPDYVGAGYVFDTTRKAKWVAESLEQSPIAGIELLEPAPLTEGQVTSVHDSAYVSAVRTGHPSGLAESQGFPWDERVWPMVLSSNGGTVAAARAALEDGIAGSLSSGLHHARANRGAGFCTFNGLVIAAREALASGAGNVLILDLDAHCGGGTASLIKDEPRIWQVDVSVNSFDAYPSSQRIQLELVDDVKQYLRVVDRVLAGLEKRGIDLDLCIYNAGMDPHENSGIGGLPGVTAEILAGRERKVFEWCRRRGLPLAFVLAGGYVSDQLDEAALVQLHRLTLDQAAA